MLLIFGHFFYTKKIIFWKIYSIFSYSLVFDRIVFFEKTFFYEIFFLNFLKTKKFTNFTSFSKNEFFVFFEFFFRKKAKFFLILTIVTKFMFKKLYLAVLPYLMCKIGHKKPIFWQNCHLLLNIVTKQDLKKCTAYTDNFNITVFWFTKKYWKTQKFSKSVKKRSKNEHLFFKKIFFDQIFQKIR